MTVQSTDTVSPHDGLLALFARAEVLARGHVSLLCADTAAQKLASKIWAQASVRPRWLHLLRADRGQTPSVMRQIDDAARVMLTVAVGSSRDGLTLLDAQVDAVVGPVQLPAHLEPRANRRPTLARPMGMRQQAPSQAVVLGAGLAGAATAHALVRRGWRVRVLDTRKLLPGPAQAASDVPAALLAAPSGDTLDARALRAGVAMTASQLSLLGLNQTPNDLRRWASPRAVIDALAAASGFAIEAPTRWADLGDELHSSDLQILCAGAASAELARALGWPVEYLRHAHPVPGQALLGQTPAHAAWRHLIEEGDGYFIGDIGRAQWLVGASYSRLPNGAPIIHATPDQIAQEREDNIQRLRGFLGTNTAEALCGSLHDWRGIRLSTRDRRPIIGMLGDARTWVFTGLGSRGLSWAFLGAELLASWLHGEPLPVEARTARALSAARFARQ